MKKHTIKNKVITGLIALTLQASCGSGNGGGGIEGVPDADVVPAMLGNWQLDASDVRFSCNEDSESNEDPVSGAVLYIDGPDCSFGSDDGNPEGVECKSGADRAAIETNEAFSLWDDVDPSCMLHVTSTVNVRYDAASEKLVGNFTAHVQLQGNCPQSVRADYPNCDASGSVEGTREQGRNNTP